MKNIIDTIDIIGLNHEKAMMDARRPEFTGFFKQGTKMTCAECKELVDANEGCPTCGDAGLVLNIDWMEGLTRTDEGLFYPCGCEVGTNNTCDEHKPGNWTYTSHCDKCGLPKFSRPDEQGFEHTCGCGSVFYRID